MSAENIPTGYGEDDEFGRTFPAQSPEAAEECVLERINALRIFQGLAAQGIPAAVYYNRLGTTDFGENTFDALVRYIPNDIQLTRDTPHVAKQKILWMRRLAATLPATMAEQEESLTEGIEGRIRPPYESKIAMQIDIAKESVLDVKWRLALLEVADQLVPGISLTDFTEEEQHQILADGDLRNVPEGETRIYKEYARRALGEVLIEYAGHDAFSSAIDELALVLAQDYLSTDVRDYDAMVFAGYHLSSMGLTSETEIVQEALARARDTLKEL